MANVTPDSIFQIATGFMAAKHLFVANELGLFEQLAKGAATLEELSGRIGAPSRTVRIIADAVVSLGFVEKNGERYQNGPVAATFLSGQTPADLRPFLRFWNQISYPTWGDLEKAVRSDQAVMKPLSPPKQKIFSEGVDALTAGPAQALAASYDFKRHQRVLDLGGGAGSFLLALLRQHGHLEGALFDQPAVIQVARQRFAGDPLSGRIRLIEGDFIKGALPEGYDAVILANVIHYFLPEQNKALFRRISEKAPAGARLLLIDFWTDPTHTQPLFAALMAGEFLVNIGGDVYSSEEARGWLQESGWKMLESRPLLGPLSLIIAEA